MKIVVAATSFKGSLSASEACQAIGAGIKQALPKAQVTLVPISDGGDSLLDSFVSRCPQSQLKKIRVSVTGPLGKKIESMYLLWKNGFKTAAVIETAKVCGLAMVPKRERNPLLTTTYGLGELMKHALGHKIHAIYIGLGGTATTDAGCGMAQALGAKLLNSKGFPIGLDCASIGDLASIDVTKTRFLFKNVEILGLSDVTNPLLGKNGAARVYAPQKGATVKQVEVIERHLSHFDEVVQRSLKMRVASLAGSGAAGGLGAGLRIFCQAKIFPGVRTVLKLLNARALIKNADVVVVGEGRLDMSSLFGKAPHGVSQIARSYHKKTVGIFGSIAENASDAPFKLHLSAFKTLLEETRNEGLAIRNAAPLLTQTARKLFSNTFFKGM